MMTEFNALESKITQVSELCQALRTENTQLRQQLISAENDKKNFAERMEAARLRLEQLAQQIPDVNSEKTTETK